MNNDSNQKTHTAALFPIPDMVTFPGTQVPLHIFEPRYRVMIKHCIKERMMLAIAHVSKIKGPKKTRIQTIESLNKNQTSYEPQKVFSAGDCELIKTTEDGRMHVEVHIKKRLELFEVKQEIPFLIVDCIEVTDQIDNQSGESEKNKMQEIQNMLIALSEALSPELHELIKRPEWINQSPSHFSFNVFKYFRFETDFMQHVLEQTSVKQRLDIILQGIKQRMP